MSKYDPAKIEKKWQKVWESKKPYKAVDKGEKKFYALMEFPYPSGDGLHTGHVRGYTAMDIVARKRRTQGFNVMFPIGWDAFGLPTENYAIKTGIAPEKVTKTNTDNFRKQFKSLGMSFDWSREVNTTDPKYYKWTQWIFLQLLKHGLAYKAKSEINWCPKDKIGLANEEVVDGKCERCGAVVEKREKEQWMLAITKYAERLHKDLDDVDYPERVKIQQRNWIGKSEGAEISFKLKAGSDKEINYVLLHGYTGSPEANFFPWLRKELENTGAKVYCPVLPNTDDPIVMNQVEAVLKDIPFNENTILIGHSLGGVVALKILEKLSKPIKNTILIGSYIENRFLDEDFPAKAFDWKFDFERIKKNAGNVSLLRDLKDISVPQDNTFKLHQKIGGQLFDYVAQKPHFCGEIEPEVLGHCIDVIKVFTTRPDTIFGATYMVLAPEHELVKRLAITNREEVENYIAQSRKKTEIERTTEGKQKTGVELKGVKAINPANKEEIPIWIADYVLPHYGTGAIMAVPSDDERDNEFAQKYNLLIVKDYKKAGFEDFGKKITRFKLRDWVFSRQRYWGEPIPVIHCEKCALSNPAGQGIVPVPEKDLPVKLPKVKKYTYTDTGESPLASVSKWVNVKCPQCKGPAKRETDTMPNWAGSSWYFLRYIDPKNSKEFASEQLLKYWQPVDWYNGGMEHTTLHLLYSRFWNKFLYDQKLVPTSEPYIKRTSHGLILAEGGVKMSKSLGNVINPDGIVKTYGADTLRLYEMFIGPFEQAVAWSSDSIIGPRRFLEKVFVLVEKVKNEGSLLDQSTFEKTIEKVGKDIEEMSFNTAISQLMICANALDKEKEIPQKDFARFIQVLAPFAPHISEELWQTIGMKGSVHQSEWPTAQKVSESEVIKIAVQINGKVRGTVETSSGDTEDSIRKLIESDEGLKKHITGPIKKVIYIPGKIISIVI